MEGVRPQEVGSQPAQAVTHQHPPLGLACGVPAGLGPTSALDFTAALSPHCGLLSVTAALSPLWPCHCHWVMLLQARAACTCAFRRQVSGSGRWPLSTSQVPGVTGVTGPHLPASGTRQPLSLSSGWAWHVLDGPERSSHLHRHPPDHIQRGYPGSPGRREGLAWGLGSRGHALRLPGASPVPGLPPATLTPAERAPSGLWSRP